jgi:hypothetical protein
VARSGESRDDDPQRRVRFESCEVETFPDSRCRCRVTLKWSDGAQYSGEAEGTETQQGRLRLGALACLRAAEAATGGRLVLELRGVKSVRAFDASVVIVSVRGRSADERYELLGSATSPDIEAEAARGSVRGAALAILDATNRVLGKFVD